MTSSGPSLRFGGLFFLAIACLQLSASASAATPLEVARCWSTYMAVLPPVTRADHGSLSAYISARIGNVRPLMLRLRSAGTKLTAAEHEEVLESRRIANQMAADVSSAIAAADDAALRRAMAPVFACDTVFGFTSFPLPKADATTKVFSPATIPARPKDDPSLPPDIMKSYGDSFLEGCRHGPAPAKFRVAGEANIGALCQCVLDASTGPAHDRIPTYLELDEHADELYGSCARNLRSSR
jgi:hypothetical protein